MHQAASCTNRTCKLPGVFVVADNPSIVPFVILPKDGAALTGRCVSHSVGVSDRSQDGSSDRAQRVHTWLGTCYLICWPRLWFLLAPILCSLPILRHLVQSLAALGRRRECVVSYRWRRKHRELPGQLAQLTRRSAGKRSKHWSRVACV